MSRGCYLSDQTVQFLLELLKFGIVSGILGVVMNVGIGKYSKLIKENEDLKRVEIEKTINETTAHVHSKLAIIEERQKMQGEVYLGKLEGVLKHLEAFTSQYEQRFQRLEGDVVSLKGILERLTRPGGTGK